MRRAVFSQPESPYLRLLSHAGCEFGDLERLVTGEGIEGALQALYRRGVFLTVDELKGRRAAVRGSVKLFVDPSHIRNPGSNVHLMAQTSGSRGRRTPVPLDLTVIRAWSVNRCLTIAARGGLRWVQAAWYVPGGDAVAWLLVYGGFGASPVRWFSQVDPAAPGLHPRYRWSALALHWGSTLARVPMPRPQFVPLDDPLPIARWMVEILRAGGIPHLAAYSSAAVRLCRAALESGIDLRGVQFSLVGEPVTLARLACIESAGASGVPSYGSIDAGPLGVGCLQPQSPDDVHLYHDLVALIQPAVQQRQCMGSSGSLFVSSLRPEAPLVLMNVSLGDTAVVTQRRCGCPLERLGWTTHLHTIRSFEKLTAGGTVILDADVIEVLEELLPARFGGGPTDYQLLEAECDDGRPDMRLLVHPRLGPLDPSEVAETFLEAIGAGNGAERILALQWRQAGLPRVERQAPLTTASGKILHLHQARQLTPEPGTSRQSDAGGRRA